MIWKALHWMFIFPRKQSSIDNVDIYTVWEASSVYEE